MKKKKLLVSCIATFAPILICIILIYLIRTIILQTNSNLTNGTLYIVLIGLLFIIFNVISFCINLRLDKKGLKITFSILSIILAIIGILFSIAMFSQYQYSKSKDKVINNFIQKVEKETSDQLKSCENCNYKNKDIIASDRYTEIESDELACNWSTEVADINKYEVTVHIICWSISDNHSYYYRN